MVFQPNGKTDFVFLEKKQPHILTPLSHAWLSFVNSVHIRCLLLRADHCKLYITLTAIKFYFIIKSLFSIRFFKTLALQHRALAID